MLKALGRPLVGSRGYDRGGLQSGAGLVAVGDRNAATLGGAALADFE